MFPPKRVQRRQQSCPTLATFRASLFPTPASSFCARTIVDGTRRPEVRTSLDGKDTCVAGITPRRTLDLG